jgi:hypothetical protein
VNDALAVSRRTAKPAKKKPGKMAAAVVKTPKPRISKAAPKAVTKKTAGKKKARPAR